jgi:hypothetical protein
MKDQRRFSLIKALILTMLLAMGLGTFVNKVHSAEYSSGYRMGQLTKFSIKGYVNKSGEGQLSMGREGTPYIKSCGKDCKKRINPWHFSTTVGNGNKVNKFSGEYVVIGYEQVKLNNPLIYSTDYRVKTIAPVDKSINLGNGLITAVPGGSKSQGFRVGRIVKASQKGHISKTYEIIVQVGNSGNQYKHMSTKSKELYSYATTVLKSAKKVKVLYTERGLLQFSMDDTKYQVYGIELLKDI